MQSKIDLFVDAVSVKAPFLEKNLKKELAQMEEHHTSGLNALLSYYTEKGVKLDRLADAWINFANGFLEERKLFICNKEERYRYSTYAESAHLYENPDFMESYMTGLQLSQYLLQLQRDNLDFFITEIDKLNFHSPASMLEVGTGHGTYFVSAILNTSFDSYLGIDISPTSIAATKSFVNYAVKDASKNIRIEQRDFFEFDITQKYDLIVMGEIIEHVEEPLKFLCKGRELISERGVLYISTAINSPFPDHLYLFKNDEEVKKLFIEAGLKVYSEIIIPPLGISLEKAYAKKYDVVVGYMLRAANQNAEHGR